MRPFFLSFFPPHLVRRRVFICIHQLLTTFAFSFCASRASNTTFVYLMKTIFASFSTIWNIFQSNSAQQNRLPIRWRVAKVFDISTLTSELRGQPAPTCWWAWIDYYYKVGMQWAQAWPNWTRWSTRVGKATERADRLAPQRNTNADWNLKKRATDSRGKGQCCLVSASMRMFKSACMMDLLLCRANRLKSDRCVRQQGLGTKGHGRKGNDWRGW